METLFNRKSIDFKTKILGKQISAEHNGDKTPVVMVQITKDLETPIKGKHVYIVDDIYDSGNTMAAVIEYLEVKHPESITIVTLLKRKTSPTPLVPQLHAFLIDKEWVVGYGMDDDKGHCRNYSQIYAL